MTAVLDTPERADDAPSSRRAAARGRRVSGARRLARAVRRVAFWSIAGLAVWLLVGVWVFVLPNPGPLPAHADVALVLGGDTPERLALAQELLADGTVDEMLWSTPDQRGQAIEPIVQHDCATLAHLICFDPDPSTTQGEARGLAAEARAHGWTSAIVISQGAHLDRARLIVRRCFTGALTMADSGERPSGGWAWEYLYQTLASVKAWVHPGC